MNSFLKNIASDIYAEYNGDLSQICVVFPSRRAGLFFKRHLSEIANRPLFSPKILTINEFVSENANIQIEDPIHLLFNLYEIHQQIEREKAYTFSDFFSFGEMMIHDFSEIDLYLVDSNDIFNWLSDEKAISFWNPDGTPLTDFQKKYLHFYQSLHKYYSLFKESLLQKRKCYEGMVFRDIAENIEIVEQKLAYKKVFFCGFNALSNSEKTIFQYLERSGKASIIWDTDEYYMNNDIQEAGKFLRKYEILTPKSDYFHQPKTIHIIGVPENVLQAKVAGNILNELNTDSAFEFSALVLADEELLVPALNSIPDNVTDVNITMGFPFTQSPVYDLVFGIFQLHIQKEKSGNKKYYYPFVEKILQNDLIRRTLDFQLGYALTQKIEELGKSYLSIADIEWLCQSLFIDYSKIGFIFSSVEQTPDIIQKIKGLLSFLSESEDNSSDEYLLGLYEIVKCFESIDEKSIAATDLKTLSRIYLNFARRIKIPFYGEPLKGLQIMGMLETRCIDFERIILLSTNEGILPSGNTQNSLIPFNIKQHFEIPTYQDRDAIFSYHFYRLIQQAKEIHLIYHTDSDGFNKGEKSRFIKQLQHELPRYSKNVKIHEDLYVASFSTSIEQTPPQIKKNEQILKLLKDYAVFPGFSPSSLNTYCNCSLRFYYLYVLKIKEDKSLSEEITSDVLGSAVHEVLETVFRKLKDVTDSNVQTAILNDYLSQVEDSFIPVLKKGFKNEIASGKNKLIVTVAIEQIKTFLINHIEFLKSHQLQIIDLEVELNDTLFISNGEQNMGVKLRGFADRIDIVDGITRIVDYKTGQVNPTELKGDEQSLTVDGSKEKWFQLMMYAWFLNRKQTYSLPFVSGIYSLRQRESELLPASFNKNDLIDADALKQFELFLKDILSEMFNPEKEFVPTNKKEHCRYCQFAPLCGK